MNRPPRHPAMGITLPELLTVLLVGVFIMLVSIPIVTAMRKDIAVSSAINTVSVAVSAAQARSRFAAETPYLVPTIPTEQYGQAAAALFTPAGEVRIAWHYPPLQRTTGEPLIMAVPGVDEQKRLGFLDESDFNYVSLPSRSLVFGIQASNATTLRLLAPPFAVLFDREGLLRPGSTPDGVGAGGSMPDALFDPAVCYAVETTSQILVTDTRPAGYLPATWFVGGTNYALDDQGRALLPFTVIESVIGVVVCDRSKFEAFLGRVGSSLAALPGSISASGISPAANPDTAVNAAEWLLSRSNPDSRIVMFNRYTGSAIREEELQ